MRLTHVQRTMSGMWQVFGECFLKVKKLLSENFNLGLCYANKSIMQFPCLPDACYFVLYGHYAFFFISVR